jgi:hypothetical protein
VLFTGREIDLWREARAWAQDRFLNPIAKPQGYIIVIPNTDLVHMDRAHPEWLKPPTLKEISLERFGSLV